LAFFNPAYRERRQAAFAAGKSFPTYGRAKERFQAAVAAAIAGRVGAVEPAARAGLLNAVFGGL
jgi:hypothetical protein